MIAGIAVLDVSLRRRSIGWSALAVALVVVAAAGLYSVAMSRTSLVHSLNGAGGAAAVFGSSGSLTSAAGWLNAGVYVTLFPLVTLLLTIAYGGRAITGQDEDGTLGLISTLPVHRPAIVLQKSAAMLTIALLLGVVVGAGTLLFAALFDLTVNQRAVVTTSTAVVLLGLDFGLITMAIATLTRRSRRAVTIGALVVAASYLVSALAQTVTPLRPAQYASLFYWSVQNSQLTYGVRPLDFAVLGAVGVAALTTTLVAFQRFDLR